MTPTTGIHADKIAQLTGSGKIRQSEVMAKIGILAKDIASIRDEHLQQGLDWWKEGVAIYWTTEAAARVTSLYAPKAAEVDSEIAPAAEPAAPSFSLNHTEEPVAKPAILSARVVKSCINQRFVYAALNGEKIIVDCGKKIASKIVGKVIRVLAPEDGQANYTIAR